MGLHRLQLRNFRLFHDCVIEPDLTAITVFLSPNGTGKTSILEAVYALSTLGSFRTTAASDMIQQGETTAEVHGVVTHDERRVSVDLTLQQGARSVTKKVLVNGQRPKSRGDVAEALPVTLFTPETIDMVRQGPDLRRQFLTDLMIDVTPSSGALIERFEHTLRQRNALLRSWRGELPTKTQRDELAVWTQDFVTSSDGVVRLREDLLTQLAPRVTSLYQELSGDDSTIDLLYERSWGSDLAHTLERAIDHDVYRGYTTTGPHRDDVLMLLNKRDARRQASQGEQRSVALALRLAGHGLVQSQRSVTPLLLLDDVFSELDDLRSHRLLSLLPRGQTLVTAATSLPLGMEPASTIDLERLTT